MLEKNAKIGYYESKPPVGGSKCLNESLKNAFKRFVQTADSFKDKASACPYEWTTDSLTQLIQNSKTRIIH